MPEELRRFVPDRVVLLATQEHKRIEHLPAWQSFKTSYGVLWKAATRDSFPWDWRFNAVHWAVDVAKLCRETAYGMIWMKAYAHDFTLRVPKGSLPSHNAMQVMYFLDNTIVRMCSCRDKLALMVLAHFKPFTPEAENLMPYHRILGNLTSPAPGKGAYRGSSPFLKALRTLDCRDFERLKKYRDLKVHRREPRVEMYGVEPHHDWGYMLPVEDERSKRRFMRSLAKLYPDRDLRETVKSGCLIGGKLFDRRRLQGRCWAYKPLLSKMVSSYTKLLLASAGCFRLLRRRAPLRRARRTSFEEGLERQLSGARSH